MPHSTIYNINDIWDAYANERPSLHKGTSMRTADVIASDGDVLDKIGVNSRLRGSHAVGDEDGRAPDGE